MITVIWCLHLMVTYAIICYLQIAQSSIQALSNRQAHVLSACASWTTKRTNERIRKKWVLSKPERDRCRVWILNYVLTFKYEPMAVQIIKAIRTHQISFQFTDAFRFFFSSETIATDGRFYGGVEQTHSSEPIQSHCCMRIVSLLRSIHIIFIRSV